MFTLSPFEKNDCFWQIIILFFLFCILPLVSRPSAHSTNYDEDEDDVETLWEV